jgi:hypothetical protein
LRPRRPTLVLPGESSGLDLRSRYSSAAIAIGVRLKTLVLVKAGRDRADRHAHVFTVAPAGGDVTFERLERLAAVKGEGCSPTRSSPG